MIAAPVGRLHTIARSVEVRILVANPSLGGAAMSTECHVCVIDIGKPGKNLGWALSGPKSSDGNDLDECVEAVAQAMQNGYVALGFEAPMFTPIRDDAMNLTKARHGEAAKGISRPFSASAGATVLVTALVIVPFVLKRLRALAPSATATLDWRMPLPGRADLLLFEAFVTNQKKTEDTRHIEDAYLAIAEFKRGIADPASFRSAVVEPSLLNLLGASMLRTGWSNDPAILGEDCLVVRV
jgi:hypothetical protein